MTYQTQRERRMEVRGQVDFSSHVNWEVAGGNSVFYRWRW
jgi:hypothetical protein